MVVNDVDVQRPNSPSGKSFSGANWSSKDCDGAGFLLSPTLHPPAWSLLREESFFPVGFLHLIPKMGNG